MTVVRWKDEVNATIFFVIKKSDFIYKLVSCKQQGFHTLISIIFMLSKSTLTMSIPKSNWPYQQGFMQLEVFFLNIGL